MKITINDCGYKNTIYTNCGLINEDESGKLRFIMNDMGSGWNVHPVLGCFKITSPSFLNPPSTLTPDENLVWTCTLSLKWIWTLTLTSPVKFAGKWRWLVQSLNDGRNVGLSDEQVQLQRIFPWICAFKELQLTHWLSLFNFTTNRSGLLSGLLSTW